MRKTFLIAAATVTALLATPALAYAGEEDLGGSLRRNQEVDYNTQRTIAAAGGDVDVQKTDGPKMDLRWEKCSDRNVVGAWKTLQNADPTPKTRIGTDFVKGAVFCLAAISRGTNSTDTWKGHIWWG